VYVPFLYWPLCAAGAGVGVCVVVEVAVCAGVVWLATGVVELPGTPELATVGAAPVGRVLLEIVVVEGSDAPLLIWVGSLPWTCWYTANAVKISTIAPTKIHFFIKNLLYKINYFYMFY
jgi:hypothetical protein